MIQITPHMRILVAVEPVDFRAGIDGLVAACRKRLEADPFSGALFVFRNRARTGVKILVYDGQGFWLCHKRLSSSRFAWWPDWSAARPRAAGLRAAGAADGRGCVSGADRPGMARTERGGLKSAGGRIDPPSRRSRRPGELLAEVPRQPL